MKWEYKVDKNPGKNRIWYESDYLEEMGQDGWELVTIVSIPGIVWYYFKRELNEHKF